jgi:hypothetical protein
MKGNTTMDFDTALAQAWNDHADDSPTVATRWPDLRALVVDESQLVRLAALMRHVHGVHLGEWQRGVEALNALRALDAYRDDGLGGQALRRELASLSWSADTEADSDGGTAASDTTLSPSDRIRVAAMTAENLVAHDAARAARWLRRAIALADESGLPDSDPMHRAIAVTSHNLACTMADLPQRSDDERALMILAAQASRHHWERAGTWLEIERAEYRLALTWLQAGDPAQARRHAQACLDGATANHAPALEHFFAWEAIGRSARAAGGTAEHQRAVERARAAFADLSEDDRGWCRASLDQLVGATRPSPD